MTDLNRDLSLDSQLEPTPTCPLCHTLDTSLTSDAYTAGTWWRCTRCSQKWNAERIATVAEYTRSIS